MFRGWGSDKSQGTNGMCEGITQNYCVVRVVGVNKHCVYRGIPVHHLR